MEIKASNMSSLVQLGMKIIQSTNDVIKVQHPVYKEINFLGALMFCKKPERPGEAHKGLVVFGNTQTDRSPCGTGTCARMARLYAKANLD